MIVLLLAYLVVGLGLICWGRRATRVAVPVAAVPLAATVAWLLARSGGPLDGRPVTESVGWVPALGVDLDLRLDGFAVLFAALVSGIGLLIVAYSARYLANGGAGQGQLLGLLVLFAGSMLGLVLADNLILLFGFWELTSITSFLLIGNDHESVKARAAALQALLITGTGGLAMLAGFVLIGQAVDGGGSFQLSRVLADPPTGTPVTVGLVLVLVGAFTKSAQYPFHSWLPGAMVAPTPISAYLHSATMVKAGVYLVGRFGPAFALVWIWRPLVVTVGLVTMVAGGLRALRQHDLKLILAFGTVSQLGFMVVMFGLGTADTVVDACELVLAHALFKAALFLVAGIVEHQTGARDIRRIPRPGPGWQPTVVVTLVSAASMAGFPLMFGFVAKEDAFAALEPGSFAYSGLVLTPVVLASVLTVAYSLRFAWGALGFAGTGDGPARAAAPSGWFVAPAAILAALTVLFGLVPAAVDELISGAAESLSTAVEPVHLAVWHGLGLPLVLSVVVLAGGLGLFLARRPVARVLALGHRVPSGGEAYLAALRGLNTLSDRVTAVVQSGSLPVYAGVILTTAALLTTGALVLGDGWPGWPAILGSSGHVAVCVMLLVTALAAGAVHRRFSAALLLGATGYAMAGLFVVQGGADLALTQVAIETLTTVLFVLVLRRLPDRFESRATAPGRVVRLAVAAAVGVTVFLLALTAAGNRTAEPVSGEMVEQSVPEGGGRNVVNVILVDFRGIDTMGEVTVLAAAAIGSVALARAGRRPRRARPPAAGAPAPAPAERSGGGAVRRIVVVDVAVRLVFIAVMVGSIYLLFAGHNQPGGGFVGGIVAGAAVALRYVAGGIDDVRALSRAHPWTVLGSGLLISALTVVVPVALGSAPLEHASWEADLPLLGHLKVTSALAFDVGVYLLVVGLVLMVFESFGDDPGRSAEADAGHELHDSTGAPPAPLPEAEQVPVT
ncbi:MAG TPA: hydrogen gas-evolving membrane-bound hydrogenase subunit E [Acidimicrobiales bacterium]|nr:hydrogen gas-evolving membrane-bound hydrogenase subunit E [Acidimicrobiales bacterium]